MVLFIWIGIYWNSVLYLTMGFYATWVWWDLFIMSSIIYSIQLFASTISKLIWLLHQFNLDNRRKPVKNLYAGSWWKWEFWLKSLVQRQIRVMFDIEHRMCRIIRCDWKERRFATDIRGTTAFLTEQRTDWTLWDREFDLDILCVAGHFVQSSDLPVLHF